MHTATRFQRAIATTLCMALGACSSTPLIEYYQGGSNVEAEARKDLVKAQAYAEAARQRYQGSVQQQMRDEGNLVSTMLGGGALLAALALGSPHRDVIAGGGLLAGTAYTVGQVKLPRTHVLVWLAGIDALVCAEKAIAPLALAGTDRDALQASVRTLLARRAALTGAMDALGRLPIAPANADGRTRRDEALQLASQVMASSETTALAGQRLLQANARAARELVAAVNGIDKAVVRSLVQSTPDLAVVPGLVAGLAAAGGQFLPPAGIAKHLSLQNEAIDKSIATQKSVKGPDVVLDAIAAVTAAIRTVEAADADVRINMPAEGANWPSDAFKSCGVAEVVAPLSSPTQALAFTAGVRGRQVFEVHGGVKPYFARLLPGTVEGVTVNSPIRFDSQVEVIVAGDKTKEAITAQIRVTDSTPGTARQLDVGLTLPAIAASSPSVKKKAPDQPAKKPDGAASAPAAAASGAGAPADAGQATLDALKKVAFIAVTGGSAITVRRVAAGANGTIDVDLACPVGAAHSHAQLSDALLQKAGTKPAVAPRFNIKAEPAACVSG